MKAVGALLLFAPLWAADTGQLWTERDVTACNVFYGPGGEAHQPRGPFTFVKEDLNGTNPKVVVHDADGVKWTVKLGAEARPETAATRLVWAAGYYANEDYFLPSIRIENLPAHLHRGQKQVQPGGSICDVRLKRHLKGEEKVGHWQWGEGPFSGTRELNGLRVLMAVINNWDLTDDNNAIYKYKDQPDAREIYMVSDLGSSFGTAGLTWPTNKARGNVNTYSHSEFISHAGPDFVDFHSPHRDSWFFLATPREYKQKLQLAWIGKHIPRADAHWLGEMLGRLSTQQLRDAFRAAGYSPEEIEGFATALERRIAALKAL